MPRADLIIGLKDKASRGLDGLKDRLKSLRKTSLLAKVGIGLLVGALTALAVGIKKSFSEFVKFDRKLREIAGLSSDLRNNINQVEDGILNLARGGEDSIEELTSGFFDLASAGATTESAFTALKTAQDLATIANGDLSTSINGMIPIIQAYNLSFFEASRVSQAVFTAQQQGKGTTEDFAKAIGQTSTQAKILGISLEENAGILAKLSLVTPNTDIAMTQLRATYTSLIKPTKRSSELMQQLGIDASQQRIENEGLIPVLQEIKKATGGNAEELGRLFENQRALLGVASLLNSDLEDLQSTIENSTGSNEEYQKTVDDINTSFSVQSKRLGILTLDFLSFGGTTQKIIGSLGVSLAKFNDAFQNFLSTDEEIKNNALQKKVDQAQTIADKLKVIEDERQKDLQKAIDEEAHWRINGHKKLAQVYQEKVEILKKTISGEVTELNKRGELYIQLQNEQTKKEEKAIQDKKDRDAKAKADELARLKAEQEEKNKITREGIIQNLKLQSGQIDEEQILKERRKELEKAYIEGSVKDQKKALEEIISINKKLSESDKKKKEEAKQAQLEQRLASATSVQHQIGNLGALASANASQWVYNTVPFPANLVLAPLVYGQVSSLFDQYASEVKFHDGGIVGKATKTQPDEVPATLQTGEQVLSRKQKANIEGRLKRIEEVITGDRTIIVDIDGREVTRAIVKYIDKYQKRNRQGG